MAGGWSWKWSLVAWVYLSVVVTIVILAANNMFGSGYEPVTPSSGSVDGDNKAEAAKHGYENDLEREFEEFCEAQQQLRLDPESIKKDCKRIHERDFTDDDLHILFSLFMIVLWGAIVRTLLRVFKKKINVPYTVVILSSGVVMGVVSRFWCYQFYTYSAIARIKPEVMLFCFLPVLVFETSFGISSHVFFRASAQIILAAFPGMVIATFMTGMFTYVVFAQYKWTFVQALFFGAIISATDPVAVVAILKEAGVVESLSVIIDGESLLNGGMAILLVEIFREMLTDDEAKTAAQMTGKIIGMFFQIVVGGPAFGYLMAKVAIFCLARIFNDAIVEITITLVSAYMTYYLSEDVLNVSGVCAVVLLGLTMSSEKTCISPEILEEMHEFWEMLSNLANTVLFFIIGIILAERKSRDLRATDFFYLILLYFALTIVRFFMLLLLSPFLSRCGYGLTIQNLIVMTWSGLRGGVGICLALQVYEDSFFCENIKLGPKVLFHTAGIVLLSLMVNGTTTKKLLDVLGLTAISPGQIEEMQLAVKHLMDTRQKGIARLKHDRYLNDANWDYIYTFTAVSNPYKDVQVKSNKLKIQSSILYMHDDSGQHPCPHCLAPVENEPGNEEYRVMTEEARLRILKALKISYWAQFEQGLLTEEAVKMLVSSSDTFTDVELAMIHTSDIKKFWAIRGFFPWLRTKMIHQFGPDGRVIETLPPKPINKYRLPFWWFVTRPWFETLMAVVIACNMIPSIWEFILDVQLSEKSSFGVCDEENKQLRDAFHILNFIFTTIYFLEFLFKLIGYGCKMYWRSKWNYLDLFVLLISLTDLILTFFPCHVTANNSGFTKLMRGLRLFRVIRGVRLVKHVIPAIINFLNGRINRSMFYGYDVAVGYLTAIDSVSKYINQMIENSNVSKKIKAHLDRERAEVIKEIGLIQLEHPGIALAVKTRHASRKVLTQMRNALQDLRMDGLLDAKENMLLTVAIEERMKRLWNSPSYIPPPSLDVPEPENGLSGTASDIVPSSPNIQPEPGLGDITSASQRN